MFVDEGQDTNDVHMRLIEKLRDGRQRLFAVGDVKQSIYGFRGALGVIPSAVVIPSAARDPHRPDRGARRPAGTTAIPPFVADAPLGRRFARNDVLSLVDNY